MQLLDTLKGAFFPVHRVFRRQVFFMALIIALVWPGIVLADSTEKHSAKNVGMSDFSLILQEAGNRSSSGQSILIDVHAQQASLFHRTLEETALDNENTSSLPLDEEPEDSKIRPDYLPSIEIAGATTNRTTTYYLAGSQTNPAPTLILAYDSEREDQFLYGMISLTIRW
jgi:hypothetical protein